MRVQHAIKSPFSQHYSLARKGEQGGFLPIYTWPSHWNFYHQNRKKKALLEFRSPPPQIDLYTKVNPSAFRQLQCICSAQTPTGTSAGLCSSAGNGWKPTAHRDRARALLILGLGPAGSCLGGVLSAEMDYFWQPAGISILSAIRPGSTIKLYKYS